MQNGSMQISNDGILTISINLQEAIGESSTGKTYLVARSDGRMEDFSAGGNDYYLALTLGMYKEPKAKKEVKSLKNPVALPWGSKPGKADLSAATARQDSNGIAPGKSGSVKIVNHKS